MRTTDFCFPLLRLRAPAPPELPVFLRGSRLALDHDFALVIRRPVNLAFHDAQFASAGFVGLARGFFSRALPIEPCL